MTAARSHPPLTVGADGLPDEEWRPVLGYEGCYEVSDFGRVRSVPRRVQRSNGAGELPIRQRVLAPSLSSIGRPVARLWRDGHASPLQIHRLVLDAFVGPRPDGMECCHNDGDPLNNRLDNLRWDTRSANMHDQVRHGVHAQARKTHCKRNHPLSGDNVGPWSGRRHCRTCQRDHARKTARAGLPPGDPRHGTRAGYFSRGCRCDACRAAGSRANAEAHLQRKAKAAS